MSDPHPHEGQAGDHGDSPEAQDRHNDLDVGAIAFIFVVGTVSVVALILALQVAYFWDENKRVEERVTSQVNVGANAVFAEQRAKQVGYAYVDADKKDVVRIPIERAMELEAKKQADAQGAPPTDAPQNGGSGARKGF